MGLLDWLLHPRRTALRRRVARQRADLARELDRYATLVDGIAFNPRITPDRSLSVAGRAATAIAKVDAQYGAFKAACHHADAAREGLRRRLADPRLDPAVRDGAHPRFERLARAHPDAAAIAALEARWHEHLEKLERIARPHRRPAKRQDPHALPPGVVRFDLQDRTHRGWWHGS